MGKLKLVLGLVVAFVSLCGTSWAVCTQTGTPPNYVYSGTGSLTVNGSLAVVHSISISGGCNLTFTGNITINGPTAPTYGWIYLTGGSSVSFTNSSSAIQIYYAGTAANNTKPLVYSAQGGNISFGYSTYNVSVSGFSKMLYYAAGSNPGYVRIKNAEYAGGGLSQAIRVSGATSFTFEGTNWALESHTGSTVTPYYGMYVSGTTGAVSIKNSAWVVDDDATSSYWSVPLYLYNNGGSITVKQNGIYSFSAASPKSYSGMFIDAGSSTNYGNSVTVEENEIWIDGGTGISSNYYDYPRIIKNYVDGGNYGISVSNADYFLVNNNWVHANTTGIMIDKSNAPDSCSYGVLCNLIEGGTYGLYNYNQLASGTGDFHTNCSGNDNGNRITGNTYRFYAYHATCPTAVTTLDASYNYTAQNPTRNANCALVGFDITGDMDANPATVTGACGAMLSPQFGF